MAKSNLYTATGDTGTTSLVGGQRIPKNSVRLEAYGTIDELSATLGAVAASPENTEETQRPLMAIQNMLFNIGCYLATDADPAQPAPEPYGLTDTDITTLETWIDTLDENTPKIRAFVLPGGTPAAAAAHIARTVCRRAERRILDLAQQAPVHPLVIKYVNRLSDYLFILARHYNHLSGTPEITWQQPQK